ncbi:hypothetical protein, conserved [Plasmodium gonderi]|uniref:Uncharacterized protein n=1 Tax=Plasmodium gonderi TaxID=77519 RepID=A0A1Y1JQN4_PLAGO|nr:hypothetical protein, conserved [Plasmodium gonderi]GAW83815.1 hypothetical protein, conserved [Plasmodium gonderi]
MKKRKSCLMLWKNILDGEVKRRNYRRNVMTTVGDYKKKNRFEIWKYSSCDTYKVDLSFDENYKTSKDKEFLLSRRISKYKSIKSTDIKYIFLFLHFNESCSNHFICKTNPSNHIPIQVLSKLNYLLLIKKILLNDTSLNRYIEYIYFNYVLPKSETNLTKSDAPCRINKNKFGDSPKGSKSLDKQVSHQTEYFSISDTWIDQEKNGKKKNIYDGNSHKGKETSGVKWPREKRIYQEKKGNFCLSKIRDIFKNEEYQIVIHSNINNRLIKHIYVEELDNQIKIQLNYLYMFDNQMMDKKILLQMYTFCEYFINEMENQTNEFLFFLDRLCEKMLHKMNFIDSIFIFYIHIKFNYYNHLFLYILIQKVEYFMHTVLTILKENNEKAKQYMNRIKYNQKSLILFFHSLSNYFFYLNQPQNVSRYMDKLIHIKRLIYSQLGITQVLQILGKNYESYTLLDYTLALSSFYKLGIKNDLIKKILLNFVDKKVLLLINHDRKTDTTNKLSHTKSTINQKNIQQYTSLLNIFSKWFISFEYTEKEYNKVMRILLILFENALWIVLKLFISNNKYHYPSNNSVKDFNYLLLSGNSSTERDESDRSFRSNNKISINDTLKGCKYLSNEKNTMSINTFTTEHVNYFTFIKLLQLRNRWKKEKKYGWEENPSLDKTNIVNTFTGSYCTNNFYLHQIESEKNNNCEDVYCVEKIRDNIKFIVNCLNSTYKIVNHFIVNYSINELGKNFNKILIYNFVNKMIYEKKSTKYSSPYLNHLYRNIMSESTLLNYTHVGAININRLFMCSYINTFVLSDFVDVYINRLVSELASDVVTSDSVQNMHSEMQFHSQLFANALGAIQNLNLRRYDIFENISYFIKRTHFQIDVVNIGNIIHSFASIKMRDVKLIEFLLNQFICYTNEMNKENNKEISEQTLSNIAISLLKLDLPNEKYNEIIFRNYKNVKSAQALINITLYICYYNFIDKFVQEKNFTHFFNQINITNMNNFTVQNQTQLRLIAFLTLHVYHYTFGYKHKCYDGQRYIPLDTFITHLNELQKITLDIQRGGSNLSNVSFSQGHVQKMHNFVTILNKNEKMKKKKKVFVKLNKFFYKSKTASFTTYTRDLNSFFYYKDGLKRKKKIYITPCHYSYCKKRTNKKSRKSVETKKIYNFPYLRNAKRNLTSPYLYPTDRDKFLINMFEIFSYKHMNNNITKNAKPLLNERHYLNLNFVASFPILENHIKTTSMLHNEIYDIIASLNFEKQMTKELSHYPYYVDIVLT